ncbi:Exodeoxyribonuclease VII large subunit [hydrothermal vent metagenome]|uniref:Exodeoxyribonuclease VII large subunit n=1 Tax=hydrothermal vent metagenome TaxID=652676 RepID=A0A3B0SMG7_9ZZZZ
MSTDWPFDPETGEISDAPQNNQIEYSVSDISFALKRTLEDTFGFVRIRAELGRVSRPASGHVYLDLKDEKAVLNGIVWKGVASRLKVQPEQGLEVVVTGKITTYPGQSRYQIIIDSMEPAGVGALMALFEERKKKLAAEGLFDEDRKKTIPYLPKIIGVVTSPSGAVIRDILHRLADRFPRHVLVWPVRVQGETSAKEVAAGIDGFNAMTDDNRPDLIIVARGGGSLEDLWGFNEEIVARAAATSDIPLISAVGHETDWTLIDYIADERAPTPTAAAERAVPVRRDLLAMVADLGARNPRALHRLMAERKTRVQSAARALPKPDDLLALARQRYDTASGRLTQALKTNLQSHRNTYERVAGRHTLQPLRQQIERHREALLRHGLQSARAVHRLVGEKRQRLTLAAKLNDSFSYKSVLARGFSVIKDENGKPVVSVADAKPGGRVSIEMQDGKVKATLDGKKLPVAAKESQGSLL